MATTLMPYSPFSELGELRERLDRVFEDLIDGRRREWRLSVDVVEESDRFVLRADVPGMTADDVDIEVSDNVLTVTGKHEEAKEEKERDYLRRERRYGSFSRSLSLPEGVVAGDIEANIEDGVLEVSIPRPKEAKKGREAIQIKPRTTSAA